MSDPFHQRAENTLPAVVLADLERAGRWAAGAEISLYLVGGAVRDVLLGRSTLDLDLMTVGGGPTVAGDLAAVLGGRVGARSPFGTWRIELPGGRHLDLAIARSERYQRPGALPVVEPSGLDQDLARRDFSVNALAVRLAEPWGEPRDAHQGCRDLERRQLRSLHPASFLDDPTRILRGIELAVRLGSSFEQATAEDALRALAGGALDTLSTSRLANAWQRCFGRLLRASPRRLETGLLLAERLGLLSVLDPRCVLDPEGRARAGRLAANSGDPRCRQQPLELHLLRVLAWDDEPLVAALADRWELSATATAEWTGFAAKLAAVDPTAIERDGRLSTLRRELAAFGAVGRLLLEIAAEPRLERLATRYRDQVEPFRLTVDGSALIAAGHAPGPEMGAALERTLEARLDGEIAADDELEYASRAMRSSSG